MAGQFQGSLYGAVFDQGNIVCVVLQDFTHLNMNNNNLSTLNVHCDIYSVLVYKVIILLSNWKSLLIVKHSFTQYILISVIVN